MNLLKRFIAWIKKLLRRWWPAHLPTKVLVFVGSGEIPSMSMTIKAGQTRTFRATFLDDNNVAQPVATMPTAVDGAGILVCAPVGTPALTDKEFVFTANCPSGVQAGSSGQIKIFAEGDPTPGVDPLTGTLDWSSIAGEDTHVVVTVDP